MMKNAVAAVALSLIATNAHAQVSPAPTQASSPDDVRRPLDLRLPMTQPAPYADLAAGKAVRNAGIALTVTGVIATIAGTAVLASWSSGQSALTYEQMVGIGAGGMAGGAVGVGVGAGMWAKGNLDIARRKGAARSRHPASRLVAGTA